MSSGSTSATAPSMCGLRMLALMPYSRELSAALAVVSAPVPAVVGSVGDTLDDASKPGRIPWD